MASAMGVLQTMAGHVPAIRVGAAVMICLCAAGFTSSQAAAQMDPAARGKMQYLHRSLLVAEENLTIAVREKDIPRARLVNDLLFNLSADAQDRKLANNPCLEALQGLAGATVAVVFHIHPAKTGDLGSMTREELRFSEQMRPAEDTVRKWFGEYSVAYQKKMADCELEIGTTTTARSLPDKLPQK